jgi:hypothetical protein
MSIFRKINRAVRRLKDVDVIVEPNLKDFTYYDLRHIDALVERGERAILAKIDDILRGDEEIIKYTFLDKKKHNHVQTWP